MKTKRLSAGVRKSLKTVIDYIRDTEEEVFYDNNDQSLEDIGKMYSRPITLKTLEKLSKDDPEIKNEIYYHICIVKKAFKI
jgi:hypothetical protein